MRDPTWWLAHIGSDRPQNTRDISSRGERRRSRSPTDAPRNWRDRYPLRSREEPHGRYPLRSREGLHEHRGTGGVRNLSTSTTEYAPSSLLAARTARGGHQTHEWYGPTRQLQDSGSENSVRQNVHNDVVGAAMGETPHSTHASHASLNPFPVRERSGPNSGLSMALPSDMELQGATPTPTTLASRFNMIDFMQLAHILAWNEMNPGNMQKIPIHFQSILVAQQHMFTRSDSEQGPERQGKMVAQEMQSAPRGGQSPTAVLNIQRPTSTLGTQAATLGTLWTTQDIQGAGPGAPMPSPSRSQVPMDNQTYPPVFTLPAQPLSPYSQSLNFFPLFEMSAPPRAPAQLPLRGPSYARGGQPVKIEPIEKKTKK